MSHLAMQILAVLVGGWTVIIGLGYATVMRIVEDLEISRA